MYDNWLKFLKQHALSLTQYHSLPQFSKDYVSTCYAESLIQGSTIKHQHISYSTVTLYLQNAGIFKRPHPILPSSTLQYPPLLQSILHEYKRWQSIPNRRHPVTLNMLDYLYKRQLHKHSDSYDCALYDWLVLGMHTGHRKSEWCQDTTEFRNSNSFSLSVQKTSTAFIAQDFKLSYKPTPQESSPISPLQPNYLEITWRFQKNGQNGQVVSFAHNYKHPHRSPVRAAERILARARRLSHPDDHPLAIFKSASFQNKNKPESISYIFHSQVEKSLRILAAKVYSISSKSELQKYSCHSLRVGACVLLHSSGAEALTIKFRLRWRSDSFMEYLRNTPKLAAMHTHVLSTTNTDDIIL